MYHEQIKALEIGKLYCARDYELLVFDTAARAHFAERHATRCSRSAVTTGWANVRDWQRHFGHQTAAQCIQKGGVFMPVEYGFGAIKVIAGSILGWIVVPDYWYNMEEFGELENVNSP